MPRTEVDSSRRSAWAFTRLRLIGYPQYLRNVSEVIAHVFVCIKINNIIIKILRIIIIILKNLELKIKNRKKLEIIWKLVLNLVPLRLNKDY